MEISYKRHFVKEEERERRLKIALSDKGINFQQFAEYCREKVGDSSSFICGSFVEGVENNSSDIDLYILDKKSISPIFIDNFNETRVDFEQLSSESILETNKKIEMSLNLSKRIPVVDFNAIYSFHRLINSVPLSNESYLYDIKRALNQEAFYIYMIRKQLYVLESRLQDAIGAYDSKSFDYSLMRSRAAIDSAFDLILAVNGDTNIRSKHRLIRLEIWNEQHEELVQVYKYFNSKWPEEKKELEIYIKEMINFIKKVIIDVSKIIDHASLSFYGDDL